MPGVRVTLAVRSAVGNGASLVAGMRSRSVCADVDAALVPGTGPLPWRVGFGEDYELLFTAPQTHRDAVRSLATMTSTPLGRIGRLDAGIGARLNGRTDWPSPLFRHFSDEGGA